MLPFSLSETDADIVNIERKTHKNPLIRDRMYILHLLHMGYGRRQSAEIVGCHPNSVTNYVKLYNSGGLEAVRRLLHRLGFKRRKVGTFPSKIDDFDARQEAFIEKLEELIHQAGRQELDLVFGDAAHFVYGKFSSFYWGKEAKCRPSGHGRYRINVYGVYDVETNQVYTRHNDGYIDADFMVDYLEWLRSEHYTDQERPLYLVLDNARYQHCQYVKECAERLNIELEFLPGYSPNLNVIERLWKYLKKILGKQYHDGKESFEKAITDLLESLGNDSHQEKLRTLLKPVFQRYEKSQILSG